MAGHVTNDEDKRNPYRDFIGKTEGKRLLERTRRRREANF